MRELVVISGKGGTGKTSLVASFAALAENVVLADCDVDAADLHLVLEPRTIRREDFSGGSRAVIIAEQCSACGKCEEVCQFAAITFDGPPNTRTARTYRIDPIACEGCGVCTHFCLQSVIFFAPVINGQWFVSETRRGPMVHARLGAAGANSGKLVSILREEARKLAAQRGSDLIIVDGSPGTGCPVIASITGADLVLIVTEPTLSGQHDLARVAALARHFDIPAMVCVNKWDVNLELASEIASQAREEGLALAGHIRYDRVMTTAQIHKRSVVEYQDNGCAADIRQVWSAVQRELQKCDGSKAR